MTDSNAIEIQGTRAGECRLSAGTIRYREAGSGEPLVFVHGVLVNGLLWRKVVPLLAKDFHCIVPDLPLGSHQLPMKPEADLSPPGVARLVNELLTSLELRDVTLVANDTGGAICELLIAEQPQLVSRLVLTPSDAYQNFLPPAFRYLQWAARVPGGLAFLMQSMRVNAMRRTPIAFGWLSKRPVEREVMDAYIRPILTDRGVRRDAAKFLRGISKRLTLEAARSFGSFERPVLLAWAPEDKFIRMKYGERLARDFPNARLELVEDSYTFMPEDQPERLAELIGTFVREPAGAAA